MIVDVFAVLESAEQVKALMGKVGSWPKLPFVIGVSDDNPGELYNPQVVKITVSSVHQADLAILTEAYGIPKIFLEGRQIWPPSTSAAA